MPRPAKGPRLHLRQRRGRSPVYVILDTGGYEESTGRGLGERGEAEKALTRYLGKKYSSAIGTHDPAVLPIADLLNFYSDAKDPGENAAKSRQSVYETLLIMVEHLLTFFGNRPLTFIKGASCRDYVRWRTHVGTVLPEWPTRRLKAVSDQTARRELVALNAAINLYHAEYTLDAVPVVTLPEMAPSKRRALSHSEAAALLAGALGFYRDRDSRKIRRRPKSVQTQRKRTARFIVIGIYSGTRHSAIISACWIPTTDGPWIDVDRGILHRRGEDEIETDKRRPPARIPPRLLAHLRRWREADLKKGNIWVISRGGKKLSGKLRRGWAGARSDAELGPDVVPHVLRHTAGTWLAQGGVKARQAADYLGMTEATFERNYYHHDPDYQSEIGPAFTSSRKAAAALKRGRGTEPKIAQETREKA